MAPTENDHLRPWREVMEQSLDSTGGGPYNPLRVAGWSSLVARWAHNPKVDGSNPSPATKDSYRNSNS